MEADDIPAISQLELDTCFHVISSIQQRREVLKDKCWLPEQLEIILSLLPRTAQDQEFRLAVNLISWIRVAGKERYGKDWLPTQFDVLKSRLFWRLRCGKDPLPFPPPTAYSCPWYELVEETGRPHWAYGVSFTFPKDGTLRGDEIDHPEAVIAQCIYRVSDIEDGVPTRVEFGPYEFKLWKGEVPTATFDPKTKKVSMVEVSGWWIQRIDSTSLDND